MKCMSCGGHVRWMGPLTNLTHTECESCGATNSQEVDDYVSDIEQDVPLRRADTENFVLGILLKFKNHRITFDDAVRVLTDRIHQPDNA